MSFGLISGYTITVHGKSPLKANFLIRATSQLTQVLSIFKERINIIVYTPSCVHIQIIIRTRKQSGKQIFFEFFFCSEVLVICTCVSGEIVLVYLRGIALLCQRSWGVKWPTRNIYALSAVSVWKQNFKLFPFLSHSDSRPCYKWHRNSSI